MFRILKRLHHFLEGTEWVPVATARTVAWRTDVVFCESRDGQYRRADTSWGSDRQANHWVKVWELSGLLPDGHTRVSEIA